MVEVSESPSHSLHVLNFTVDGFDRSVGEPAVIQASGTAFLHHDERVNDGLTIALQEICKRLKYRFAAAAVVSNDTSSMTEQYDNAPDSICPAGWRLPIGRDSANTASSREWNALLMAESIMNEPTGIGYDVDGFNKIRIASLWLVRSGYITYGSQTTLSWVGSTGEYHTSTVGGIGTSYNLFISEYNLNPAYASNRPIGYPVRCLVK